MSVCPDWSLTLSRPADDTATNPHPHAEFLLLLADSQFIINMRLARQSGQAALTPITSRRPVPTLNMRTSGRHAKFELHPSCIQLCAYLSSKASSSLGSRMFSSGSHVLYLFREQTVSSEDTLACQTVADIDRHWLQLAQTQSLTNKSSHV